MKFKLFTLPACPNCPIVKEYMEKTGLEGEVIDASQPEGLAQAQKFGVQGTPTVLFFDGEKQVFSAHMVDEIKEFLDNNS